MKLRKLALACAAIPAALFLTGCGSDDDTTTSTGVQLYVNNATSGSAIIPLDLYNVNGSSFTKTAGAVPNLRTANFDNVTNVVSTAGTDIGNSLVTFSSNEDNNESVRMVVYPVESDGTLAAGITATRTNELGGDLIFATEFATAGAAIDADGENVPYVVLTNGFVNIEDGDVAIAIPAGTQTQPTFAALSVEGAATSGAAFGQIALQQNTAVKQPVAYVTSLLPTDTMNVWQSAITRCQFSLDENGAPAVVGNCLNKTNLNDDLGDGEFDPNTGSGVVITDVAGTAGGQNMIAVAQGLEDGEVKASAIVNCPVSNWG